MNTRHILTYIAALFTALSCVEGPAGIEENDCSLLKVKFDTPELIVKSGNDAPVFYAYIPSELKAGNANPIGYTDVTSDGYYLYNLPEGTTDVVFTNISNANEEIAIKTDSEGRILFELLDEHPMFGTEVLYGALSGADATSSFAVSIKRFNATLSHYFNLIDSEGNSLSTDEISRVNVRYSGLGSAITIAEDGTPGMSLSENSQSYGFSTGAGSADRHLFTKNIIPTETVPTMIVDITFTNGSVKQYVKTLSSAFEPNHHYTVNLRLKQLNGEATFTLEEPDIYTTTQYPYFSAQEFFTLTGGTTVGSKAGDKLVIDIDTALPYKWSCTPSEGSDSFFKIEVVDGQLVITALSDNADEIRSATIVLSTAEGYTKTITINQKNSLKHRIVMTSQHDYSYTYIYVTGENITVQDPNDAAPVVYEGTSTNRCIEIDGLTNGAQATIEGDVITGFRATGNENGSYTDTYGYSYDGYSKTDGYYYSSNSRNYNSFTFENCTYMEDLVLQGYDATIDVSGMPQLKRLHIQQNSSLTSIVFAENQPVEHLTLYNCDALTGVGYSSIASTVKTINLYDCDGLTGAIINNCTALKNVNLNYCSSMKVINLTGCAALETLYIRNNTASNLILTDCSALKDLTLYSMSLNKITNDGADNIENIYTDALNITTFDFAGKTSLKTVGAIRSVETLNVSNCTALNDLTAQMSSEATTQSVNLEGSGLKNLTLYYLKTDCDFSTLSNLKKLYLYHIYDGVTKLDLSSCSSLEELYAAAISYYLYSDHKTIESLSLPQSIKKVNIQNLHGLTGTLNLSGLSNLTELDLYHIGTYIYNGQYLTRLNLSGCTSLKSINKNDSDNDLDDNSNPQCYEITSVDLTNCSALEYFNMKYSKITSLDFSACTNGNSLYYVNVQSNNMDATAIDNMIATFPDRLSSPTQGVYVISDNPGSDSHNETAANNKGWWL